MAASAAAPASWLARAVAAVRDCECVLVTAGAGMGCDSGLPDFRGPEGFWRAYPPMKALGLEFSEVSNPQSFRRDPRFGWGFFGHRYNLYDAAVPHRGYHVLRDWQARASQPGFVFTSNVDGQFERAGFPEDRVVECHGSIHFLQCTDGSNCAHSSFSPTPALWPVGDSLRGLDVNNETFMADGELPMCPCGKLARPCICMFGDWGWVADRTAEQEGRLRHWRTDLPRETRLLIVEIGAGKTIDTVRRTSEQVAESFPNSTLLRINPREPEAPEDCAYEDRVVSIPERAMAALEMIESSLSGSIPI